MPGRLQKDNREADGSESQQTQPDENQPVENRIDGEEKNEYKTDESRDDAEAYHQVETEVIEKEDEPTRGGQGEPQENEGTASQGDKIVEATRDDDDSAPQAVEVGQEEAEFSTDPDIEVIDGTTIHLSDLLPTPVSEEPGTHITPTPTLFTSDPGPASAREPGVDSQGQDLNPTRSTGQANPGRKQDESWIVVQNSKDNVIHQDIEDQHAQFIEEAQKFMETRNTDNMSPQMGKVVKDLLRKGVLDAGQKENKPTHNAESANAKDNVQPKSTRNAESANAKDNVQPKSTHNAESANAKDNVQPKSTHNAESANAKDNVQPKSDNLEPVDKVTLGKTNGEIVLPSDPDIDNVQPKSDNLEHLDKVTLGKTNGEIVFPSDPDLDQDKINNFFKQLMMLPQFRNQPEMALQELNKYLETPHTRVGLTKNDYQLRQLKLAKEQQQKHTEEKEGSYEEKRREHRDEPETESKTQTQDQEEHDPKKFLRDGQQSQGNVVGDDAYLQAQEKRRKKESEMRKGDEGDYTQAVRQEDDRDMYAQPPDGIKQDVQYKDSARLIRESELQKDLKDTEIPDDSKVESKQPQETEAEDRESNQNLVGNTQGDEQNIPQTGEILHILTSLNINKEDHAEPENVHLESNPNSEPDMALNAETPVGTTAPSTDDLDMGGGSPPDSRLADSQGSGEDYQDNEPHHQETMFDHRVDQSGVQFENTQHEDHEAQNGQIEEEKQQDLAKNNQENEETNAQAEEEIPDVVTSSNSNQDDNDSQIPQVKLESNDIDESSPQGDEFSTKEHSRPEEVHQSVKQMFDNQHLNDVASRNSISDSDQPEVSGPPSTQDSYLDELHRTESTTHPPVESHVDFIDIYKDDQETNTPSDPGRSMENGNSDAHPEIKVDPTPDPYREEMNRMESTTHPPPASLVEDTIIYEDEQKSNIPSGTGSSDATPDPFHEEMHRFADTPHLPPASLITESNIHKDEQQSNIPSDTGKIFKDSINSGIHPEIKVDTPPDPYLEEMHRMDSTTPPSAASHVVDTNIHKDEQQSNTPSDTGRNFKDDNSDVHPEIKVGAPPDPYLEEMHRMESTTHPPVASHVADTNTHNDEQHSNTPSNTGRDFEGGNSELHPEAEADTLGDNRDIPNRFNRRVR